MEPSATSVFDELKAGTVPTVTVASPNHGMATRARDHVRHNTAANGNRLTTIIQTKKSTSCPSEVSIPPSGKSASRVTSIGRL